MNCALKLITVIIALISFQAHADVRTRFFLQRLNDPSLDLYTRMSCIDSLLSQKLETGLADSLLFLKAEFANNLGEYAEVGNIYRQMKPSAIGRLPLNKRCRIEQYNILALLHLHRHYDCLESCLNILGLDKPDSLIYYDALVNQALMSLTPSSSKKIASYIADTERLLQYAEERNLPFYTVETLRYALLQMRFDEATRRQDYEKALEYGTTLVRTSKDPKYKLGLKSNIAFIYMRIGRYEDAEKSYLEVLSAPSPHSCQASTLMNYTHMLNLKNRFEESLAAFEQWKDKIPSIEGDIYHSYLLVNKGTAQAGVGDYRMAYNTLTRAFNELDSICLNTNARNEQLLINYLQQKEHLADVEERCSEATGRETAIIIIAAVLLFSTVALLILYIHLRNRAKSRERRLKDLAEASQQIHMQQEESENSDKARIAERLLHIAEMEESIARIKEIVGSASVISDEPVREPRTLAGSMSGQNDTRSLFEQQLDQSHREFLNNLYAAYPDLTPSEARICIYLVMNLSTKEIASITHKSIRSVESARYRIRKKLGVREGESPQHVLRHHLKNSDNGI